MSQTAIKDKGKSEAVVTVSTEVETPDLSKDPVRRLSEQGAADGTGDRDATIFANSMIKSLYVYLKLFRFFLRFPFSIVKDEMHYVFVFRWKSVAVLGFLFTSFLVLLQLCCIIFNVVMILLNQPKLGKVAFQPHYYNYSGYSPQENKKYPMSAKELRASEMYLFHRNIVPVIIIISSLMCSTFSNSGILFRRKFLCDYYSFWTTAVELMRIDAAFGVAKTMTIVCVLFFIMISLLLIFALSGFAPITFGFQTISAFVTYRMASDGIFLRKFFWAAGIFHGFFVLYVFINAKSIILLFLWTCRLLINLFKQWNMRLDSVLHNRAEAQKDRIAKVASRTGYDHLFKDYVCILDLMEGCDTLFGQVVESYYITTIASICFEIFYVIRSQSEPNEFVGARKYDFVVMLTYLIHTCFILCVVTWSAATISDEALHGLDIVRRKGTIGRKKDDELYFMLSMYVSYSGHFDTALTMGGYFVIDKGFLVGLFGTIISYFIVMMQFRPPLIMKNQDQLKQIKDLKGLLYITEWDWNHGGQGQSYPEESQDFGSSEGGLTFFLVPPASSFNSGEGALGKNLVDNWDFDHDFEFLQYLNATNSQKL